MAILEILNNKISELKENSQEELARITSILNIINMSEEALNDELKFKDFDFSIAIKLVNLKSFGILDLKKLIRDIKNTLIAKYDYNQTFLSLKEEQKEGLNSFKVRLGYLKEEFEKAKEEKSKIKIDEETLENLESLKNLLEGKGRRKYYTYEMLESLFEVIDYDSFSYEEMEELISKLSVAKNNKGHFNENKVDVEEIINLLKEYFDKSVKIGLLKQYESEICGKIDLVNAKNILEFFKEENILDRFNFMTILPIIVYGRFEYIKEFYYERVLPKDDKLKDLYFDNAMSGVWINENSSKRRHNSIIRRNSEKDSKKTLYSTVSEICDDDVWENIRLIKENEELLSEKYDLSNIDCVWVITKPTWLIKKNIELFKLFNFRDIKLSALVQMDLEEKIHFATELGLLNSPRTYVFREIEKNVPRYREFMLNGKRKKHYDNNILNYYPRNTSELGKASYTEYIYWFYKMQRSSKEEFYSDFFSSFKAGQRNKTDFYTEDDKKTLGNSDAIERIIDENFVSNYYDTLIPGYDIYLNVIKEYNNSLNGDIVVPYYDESILNDEAIQRLEEHLAIDIYSSDGEIRKVNNPYVYVFDKTIISRYKVLRNLSILKHKYGYLNDDMVLTAVIYNSYINEDTFNLIKESIRKNGEVKWTI